MNIVAPAQVTTSQVLVANLERQGVKHIFGVPGAKIDHVFDSLVDSTIETITCRHEQNAAFIAQGIGRLTGRAGVVCVTSGPGCSNLVTGLATANTEGDPVVALGGSVPVPFRLKETHQSLDTVSLFRPVTKFAAAVDSPESVSEVIANAFRCAESGRPGAAFVSLPDDIMAAPSQAGVLAPVTPDRVGVAASQDLERAAEMINRSKKPALLLGLLASQPQNAQAVRDLLSKSSIAVASTYQAAGVIPRDLLNCFAGRVGLFRNQPADRVLEEADLVIAVGFDPVEYDPVLWNRDASRPLIHVSVAAADIDASYFPAMELLGEIAPTLVGLARLISPRSMTGHDQLIEDYSRDRQLLAGNYSSRNDSPVHPLSIIGELQDVLSDDVTLCVDVGSFYIWIARHLYSYRARQILFSNGQQTLGVGLPWAIAACLTRTGDKVISVSGDGGFLYSCMELETAVRLKCNLVHLVWIDGEYNMVAFQQQAKYGRTSAVKFGPVDVVKLAEAFGAQGFHVQSADALRPTLRKAMNAEGPSIIGIPVDYSDNHILMEQVRIKALV